MPPEAVVEVRGASERSDRDTLERNGTRPLLLIDQLHVRYASGAVGVEKVSFTLAAGSFTGLIGRNGAGKTTTLFAVAGFPKRDRVVVSGVVQIDGTDVSGLSPRRRSELGIVVVPERDKMCPSLTVAEHLRLLTRDKEAIRETMERFPVVARKAKSPAGLLSGGERQLVSIALASSRRPRLILLDELSLGLAPVAVAAVLEGLEALRQDGTTILVVDQDASSMLESCDSYFVLDHGVLVDQQSTEAVPSGTVLGGVT